ncbi:hypothetical protein [Brucella pseudintermedia]|uniref:COG3904 family protein n=1 Tax=Brucella pseudintermedia TaxID=370111 RepID=UPI0030F3A432
MQFEYTPPQTEIETALGGFRCINAYGPVNAGDDERFIEFLSRAEVPPRTEIYIDSGGGHVETALNIGRTIREHWLSTSVGQYLLDTSNAANQLILNRRWTPGRCMSAATMIYLGGRLRHLDSSSQFGVHQFSFRDPSPDNLSRSQILSAKIARFVFDMGIPAEFLELSSAVNNDSIQIVPHEKLRELRVITGGETTVDWTVQSRNNFLYIRGERDSLYGHHKMILGATKNGGFYVHAVIESQGREEHLTQFPLVELVFGGENEKVIDISDTAVRTVVGIYTNILAPISNDDAIELLNYNGIGLRVRGSKDAGMFLGIAPMSIDGSEDLVRSFIHILA